MAPSLRGRGMRAEGREGATWVGTRCVKGCVVDEVRGSGRRRREWSSGRYSRYSRYSRQRFLRLGALGVGVAVGLGAGAAERAGAEINTQPPPAGHFGRLFNLPSFAASIPQAQQAQVDPALRELGKPGGLMDAMDPLEVGAIKLITDPELSPNNPDNPDPDLTAGTTFLGQFIDHDITLRPVLAAGDIHPAGADAQRAHGGARPGLGLRARLAGRLEPARHGRPGQDARGDSAGSSRTCPGTPLCRPSWATHATTRT